MKSYTFEKQVIRLGQSCYNTVICLDSGATIPTLKVCNSWILKDFSGVDGVTNFLNFWASHAEITFRLLKSFCFLKLSKQKPTCLPDLNLE
jgi:hypothetical protein